MKKTILAAIAFAMACVSSTSTAQNLNAEPKFYAGLSGGISTVGDDFCDAYKRDADKVNLSCDETAPTARLSGGWRLTDNFTIEAGFNWHGTTEYTFTENNGTNGTGDDVDEKVEFDYQALDISFLGEYEVTEGLFVNARLGLSRWQSDWESAGDVSSDGSVTLVSSADDESGIGLVYGLGATYLFSDQFSANLNAFQTQIDDYDGTDSDLTSFIAGLNYRF